MISSVSWVTAIELSLPRGPDVPKDDVVDQSFDRRQVVGKDDAVGWHLAQGSALEDLLGDRQQLRIFLGLGSRDKPVDGCGAGCGIENRVREPLVAVNGEHMGKDGIQRAAQRIYQPVVGW